LLSKDLHTQQSHVIWRDIGGTGAKIVTHTEKTQVCLRKKSLTRCARLPRGSGWSVAEIIRDAIRQVVLKPHSSGPVAIWDGKPKRTSIDHNSVHDEP
jgi:hypothetical protein